MSFNFVKKACVFDPQYLLRAKSRTTATPAMRQCPCCDQFFDKSSHIAILLVATPWQIVFKVDISGWGLFSLVVVGKMAPVPK